MPKISQRQLATSVIIHQFEEGWVDVTLDFSGFFSSGTADATLSCNGKYSLKLTLSAVCKNCLQQETNEMEIGWIFNNSPFFFKALA